MNESFFISATDLARADAELLKTQLMAAAGGAGIFISKVRAIQIPPVMPKLAHTKLKITETGNV